MPISFKKILLLLISTFSFINVSAEHYYFKHFQAENGLAHNTVLSLMQDKRGFLWIGTRGGLNRFDGNTIKNFNNKSNPYNILGDNQVFSICEDKTGLIWFGTSSGLYFYNPVDETFKKPTETKHLLIETIVCDKENQLWLISNDKILKYDVANRRVINTKLFATTICFDELGDLWFGNRAGQLKKLDRKTKKITTYQIINSNYQKRYKTIGKILVKNHQILIGTQALGIQIFNIDSKITTSIIKKDEKNTEIYVRDIIAGSDNNFWIASENGLFKYNLSDNKIVHLKKRNGDPYSITDNAVYTLCKDNQGGIWAGTYFGGLNYYSKETNNFEKYYPLNYSNTISGNAVREISSIDGKHIWIGTEDAGLAMLDTASSNFINYTSDGKNNSISYPNIHGLLAEKDKVFIGPFLHGLEILDIPSGKIKERYPIIEINKTANSNFVMSIFRTSQNTLLLGTTGKGLLEFNEKTKKFKQKNAIPTNSFIYCITEDHNGTIWTGSLSRGAFYYHPITHKNGNISFKGKSGLNEKIDFAVQGILEDHQNNLWFATDGGGIIKLSKDYKTFKRYTTKNGLPSNNIYRILEDKFGNLWASSLKGLICFNIKNEKIKVFTQANGLLTNQFNFNSAYKSPDGKMYFGSVKGMIAFNPSSFNKPFPTPPLYITNLQIDNQDVVPQLEGSPLKKSILNTDSIVLNYKQSNFNIEFAAISFASPEVIRYRYKMDGLDNSWTYLENNRKAYFTDLSAGNYTFRVIAESNISAWKAQEKKIFIKVLPPYWKSVWAYILYFLIVILIIHLSIKYYQRDIENKNRRKLQLFELEKEREVYHAKIEFFNTIAHEIQTPLTLIKGPIGWAIEKIGDTPIKKNLLMVEKNTDRLLDLTSHLLDFRKAEINQFGLNFVNRDIPSLLKDQVDIFQSEAQNKGISLVLNAPNKNFTAFVDKEAFTKIMTNLLSNAVKYGEKSITIKLFAVKPGDKNFKIHFINDGDTISKEEQSLIFKPFFRANNGKNKQGTGIGLSLSKSLAELHNGELKLIYSENDLTIFELSIPIHQKFEFILGK